MRVRHRPLSQLPAHFSSRSLGWVCALLAVLALSVPSASARAGDLNHWEMVLGLLDPAQRTEEGTSVLRQRLRERLVAARVPNFSLKVDSVHREIVARVYTKFSLAELNELLTAPGHVEVVRAAHNGELLRGLGSELPAGVALDWTSTPHGEDLFLSSQDASLLRATVNKVVMLNYRLVVGRSEPEIVGSYRSYFVPEPSTPITRAALRSVKITSGLRPAYHVVSTYWSSSVPDGTSADLAELTASARGGALLLMVDGEVVSSAPITQLITHGELTWRMPVSSADEQLALARMLAGKMASGPHSCEIVVIHQQEVERWGDSSP